MATKEEIKKRTETLKSILKTSDGVSKEALKNTLDIKERSLENMIKELKNAGWDIVNEKGLYFLRNKTELEGRKEEPESQKTDVYKVLILFCLIDNNGSKLSLTERELYKAVTGENGSVNSEWFTAATSELVAEGYLYFKNNKYSLGMNAPRLVVGIHDDYDDTMLLDLTRELGQKSDDSEAINRIKERLEWQYSGKDDMEGNNNVFIRQGRHKNMDAVMGIIKDKLLTVPYMEKAIALTYKTRGNEIFEHKIKVGMLLYSASLDCTYVLGENASDPDDVVCMRITGIDGIQAINEIDNDVYNSEKYNNIYKKMFGIGYGKEENVEIAFADRIYVKNMIDKLYAERKKQGGNPTLRKMEDGRWLYSDSVINIHNLLPYVRRLRAENCEILSPQHMRDEMKVSAERMLERYNV